MASQGHYTVAHSHLWRAGKEEGAFSKSPLWISLSFQLSDDEMNMRCSVRPREEVARAHSHNCPAVVGPGGGTQWSAAVLEKGICHHSVGNEGVGWQRLLCCSLNHSAQASIDVRET